MNSRLLTKISGLKEYSAGGENELPSGKMTRKEKRKDRQATRKYKRALRKAGGKQSNTGNLQNKADGWSGNTTTGQAKL